MKNIEQFDSMPLKRLVYCESIDDVMEIRGDLERIYEGNQLWFRGVSKACYRLKPSIQRNAKLIADQFGRFVCGARCQAPGRKNKQILKYL